MFVLKKMYRYVLAIGMFLATTPVWGQLTSPNANGKLATDYTNPRQDSIFVFNQTPNAQKGDLTLQYRPLSTVEWKKEQAAGVYEAYKTITRTVRCSIDTLAAGNYRINVTNIMGAVTIDCTVDAAPNPDGTYTVTVVSGGVSDQYNSSVPKGRFTVVVDNPVSDYAWYRFDYAGKSFENTPFATVPGAYSSSMNDLDQGGYMVKVQSAAVRDSFVAWVYHNPGFELHLQKDNNGAVYYLDKYCDRTDFLIDSDQPIRQSVFEYYNPVNGSANQLNNTISFSVTGSGSSAVILRVQGSLQYFRIYNPPYEDTRYTFTGQDRFGAPPQTDDILYETIVPHAVTAVTLPAIDPNSSPVEAKFVNQSTNATEYFWRFDDGDSTRFDLENPHPDTLKHTYTIPKEYSAVLLATNAYGCQDSTTIKVRVDPSKLEVANVFSPNGDGINDYFKPENTSIRQFEISIYTRAGKRVYQYKGGDLRHWQGWDGRIENSGKDAATGIYFYVLRAIGWDSLDYGWKDKKTNNDTYRSYVYLYR
jgi:gliding motility-associated-like protein